MPKRSYSSLSYNARYKRARTQGRAYKGTVAVLTRGAGKRRRSTRVNKLVISRVNNLYKMIETKELSHKTASNVGLTHNNTLSLQRSDGLALNIFYCGQGADDPMVQNSGSRVGDQFNCKGVMIKGFFENAINRSKVHYRVMLLRGAKGDSFARSTIFKGDSDNKMIDQVNTERFTIIAQKTFNIQCANSAPTSVDTAGQISAGGAAGIGSKVFKMWIPGYKFGRNGTIQFENASVSQVKFFDYRIVVVAYDWYGTPQDINTVGRINELYTKCYFKDA